MPPGPWLHPLIAEGLRETPILSPPHVNSWQETAKTSADPGWKQKTQGHGKREAWITKGWRPPGPRGRVERGMGAIRNEGRQREF